MDRTYTFQGQSLVTLPFCLLGNIFFLVELSEFESESQTCKARALTNYAIAPYIQILAYTKETPIISTCASHVTFTQENLVEKDHAGSTAVLLTWHF